MKKWIAIAFLTSALILGMSSLAHADKKVEVIKAAHYESK
ncbi:hypothetical protein ACUXCC_004572 [Cytobacillus horneckiae]